ncbi:MAG TPA: NADH-quinone oxidoreductase subunit M, partial [Methylococcaceae bacterium]|nr:NADH-quinone oxidoreductase subunit M [Methylococcaceae bacterium]
MQTLSLILWTPAIGALVTALVPEDRLRSIRGIAFASTIITLLLGWSLVFRFDTRSSAMQFAELAPWNPELGSSYA